MPDLKQAIIYTRLQSHHRLGFTDGVSTQAN